MNSTIMDQYEQNWQALADVARNPYTPPQELDILARDKDPIVRRLVAGNYSTSPETLDYLSYDTDEDVIKGIANNPVAWATTLKRISRPDEINHDMLFSSIISNPFISPDKLSSITKIYNCMKPNKNHTS